MIFSIWTIFFCALRALGYSLLQSHWASILRIVNDMEGPKRNQRMLQGFPMNTQRLLYMYWCERTLTTMPAITGTGNPYNWWKRAKCAHVFILR